MPPELLPAIALILFIASLIQGAVGFAFGLFALTFLTLLGLELTTSVPLLLTSGLAQLLVGVIKLRDHIQYPPLIKGTAIRYITLPLGIIALGYLTSTIDKSQIEQLVGALIFLIVLTQIIIRPAPQQNLHAFWTWLAFSASGFIAGMIAVGGPPIVLWVMAHEWTNRQIRSFLFASFLTTVPVNAVVLYLVLGDEILTPMFYGLAFSPLIALGSHLGVKIGHAFSTERLRSIAFGILAISSVSSIAGPLLH
ncbi:TSUP family transporter [Kiloniella laminariae]|uniref:TSUP family transporter n=1 Tax=Kiloniella laminariae TaxID=454162 RepID=UPI0003826975|nr:TSUP family transporter [Kiloniella laminariae]